MDYQTYLSQKKTVFPDSKAASLNNIEATVAYEEVFKWEWIATKLKVFTFIAYAETIDTDFMENYSSACLQYAHKNKKGLPLGFQNGIVCNNVIVSNAVDNDVISLVTSRPKKHYCVFEMPIILDLSNNNLYYYKGDIIWGMMYNSFIKGYIANKISAIV